MGTIKINVGKESIYKTINSAINQINLNPEKSYSIELEDGFYKEKVVIKSNNISIIGSDPKKCIISFDDNASKILPDNIKMGTFNSFTMYISGENFFMENITVENSSGTGNIVGQAVALYADSDKIHLKNCRLLGHQDTLCTGPLPIDPIPKGINEILPYNYYDETKHKVFRQYYENCYIEGDIDFIFGSARAIFNNCEIYSIGDNIKTNGYITAASHDVKEKYGYIFSDCNIVGNGAIGSVYLGRPWRPFAKTTFLNCYLSNIINPYGWQIWNGNEKSAMYQDIGCRGEGADKSKRADWTNKINDKEVDYSFEEIFNTVDIWLPKS